MGRLSNTQKLALDIEQLAFERERIAAEEDYCYLKRFNYSVEKFLERYPEGSAPDHLVAEALLISERELPGLYRKIVAKLRGLMRVDLE